MKKLLLITSSILIALTTNAQIVSTVAGGGVGDGLPAIIAPISADCVAVDVLGNIYIGDRVNHRIREVNASTGIITTIAGNGINGTLGDNGLATSAQVRMPTGLVLDSSGNIYFLDWGKIRKITVSSGIISTVAGGGTSTGDNVPATSAGLNQPVGVALDSAGNIYILEFGGGGNTSAIRKVTASTGIITTIASNLSSSRGITVDNSGNIYIATSNFIVKLTASTGIMTTVAGNGNQYNSGDNGLATSAGLDYPIAVALDAEGNIYITAGQQDVRIRKVTVSTGIITTVAGNGIGGYSGDNGLATSAQLSGLRNCAIDASGNIYIATSGRIRKVTASTGIITTVAGKGLNYSGDGILATSAKLNGLSPAAFDNAGNIYLLDGLYIRKVTLSTGIISTVAGNETYGSTGDNGPATSASFCQPTGIALDSAGNIYISEFGGCSSASLIRKVTASTGIITTIAGGGSGGDGELATLASLQSVYGITVDSFGNIYIAETSARRIRKVTASTGIITTVAGNGNNGYSGDNGIATSAGLDYPQNCAIDASGNIYIPDSGRIRKVTASTGIITTVAGNGIAGYSGDNGLATSAQLNYPRNCAIDASGNIYIADGGRIRKVTASTGIITTVAGAGPLSFIEDGACSLSGQIGLLGIALDNLDNLYFGEAKYENYEQGGIYENIRLRKITNFTITSQPATVGTCNIAETTFSVIATGVVSYQWQVNMGSGFNDIVANSVYYGENTATLHITGAPFTMNGYSYQCILTSCISTVNSNTATLIVNASTDLSTTLTGSTITANQAGATYQWLNCTTGNSVISGATNQSYTPTTNDAYSVQVTIGNCTGTSACVSISEMGVNDFATSNQLNIYPNPTKGLLQLKTPINKTLDKIIITDIMGKVILEQTSTNTINVEKLASGVYVIKSFSGKEQFTSKFIKE